MRMRLVGLLALLVIVSCYALFVFFQEKNKNIIIISIDTLRADHMVVMAMKEIQHPG